MDAPFESLKGKRMALVGCAEMEDAIASTLLQAQASFAIMQESMVSQGFGARSI